MERRKNRDFWARLLFYLNIVASILLLIIFFVFHRAQPEFESLFDRLRHLNLRTAWDIQFLYYLIYIIFFSIFICAGGLLLGKVRARRKSDSNKMMIITGITSLGMLLISWVLMQHSV